MPVTLLTAAACVRNDLSTAELLVVPDPEDRQSLQLRYPTVTPADTYIVKVVKIESARNRRLIVTVRLLTRCLGLEARGEFGIVDEVIEELVPGSGRETRFA